MTSGLLVPRRRRGGVGGTAAVAGSTAATEVLDWESALVSELADEIPAAGEREWLRSAHGVIRSRIRPVYALNDLQSASTSVRRGRGSCSQRLAVLEAVARGRGIRTRVEGLAVDGRFWYPRFGRLRPLVPRRVVLAWPEFFVADQWLAVGELFETAEPGAFTNAGAETLFDAIGRTGVAWGGDCADGVCDLSGWVVERLGYFDHRDELFAQQGQTLCWTARTIGEPVLSYRSA